MLQHCYHVDIQGEAVDDATRGRALVMYQLAWPRKRPAAMQVLAGISRR
jgi:hypothetical protein